MSADVPGSGAELDSDGRLERRFEALCEPLPLAERDDLSLRVDDYSMQLQVALAGAGGEDLRLAKRIATRCQDLLEGYQRLDAPARAAVVGAVRFFVGLAGAENALQTGRSLRVDAAVVDLATSRTGGSLPPLLPPEQGG